MKVIKRNKTEVEFDSNRIINAIKKAKEQINSDITMEEIKNIADYVKSKNKDLTVEEIQDLVVKKLMSSKHKDLALSYQTYRTLRAVDRLKFDKLMNDIKVIYTKGSDLNSNKPSSLRNVKRDLAAGEVEKLQAEDHIPSHIFNAHKLKRIYLHDLDFFGYNPMTNCSIIDLKDMLSNGTRINNAEIEKPHSIGVAATIASQIVANVAHLQYGRK